jgi:hypothetical protein
MMIVTDSANSDSFRDLVFEDAMAVSASPT